MRPNTFLVVGLLLLVTMAAPTEAEEADGAPRPQLLSVVVPVNVREDSVSDVIREQLATLQECVAVSRYRTLEKPEVLGKTDSMDDRVEVVISSGAQVPERIKELPKAPAAFAVTVRAVLSDKSCVAEKIRRWPLAADQLLELDLLKFEGNRVGAPIVFQYRFRPSREQREETLKQNREAWRAVCAALTKGASSAEFLQLGQRLPTRWGQLIQNFEQVQRNTPLEDVPRIRSGYWMEVSAEWGVGGSCAGAPRSR